uniref:Uncharacterized protein n=1 Tax=Setaria viridis TaxID=4556 RepID=A0A4U6V7K6_SETVI|nr:hypothetical protein SEVIR_3G040850v2 [Setaria viridis]
MNLQSTRDDYGSSFTHFCGQLRVMLPLIKKRVR